MAAAIFFCVQNQRNAQQIPPFGGGMEQIAREMTEHTEKDVLMKCTKCGYEEEVPRWLIDELFPNEPEENYMMHCPECDHKMIVKK